MSGSHTGNLVLNLVRDAEPNVAKALRFGRKFLAQDWTVVLSINLDGVRLLDPACADRTCPVTGKPLLQLLDAFIAEGGEVLVGAECLKLAGLGQEVYREGMATAEIGLWQDVLSRPGTVVFTY